ncbi:hypothetical protein MPTK1_7g15700 [Marchantia polymorpha subsp. ruderalis]|nr:hypothetical protein MARPO_0111s0049 [Marchantia polymorpha]BBN17609.1 hypothetical protein Mp_7g15700 [Marchantia polymorpha subsp. ruderalis]|eukprot:PTQ31493.1 hypothetical protein MARPO_0111s0049 [Marchantia polymorpha]
MRVRPVDPKSGNEGLRIQALCSLMCNTTMKISLVLGVLAILVCEHTALAQTSTIVIEVGVDEVFTVECYAFESDTSVQKYYGLWEMQLHQSLQVAAADSSPSSIVCHFVLTGVIHLHQAFPVYLKSGLMFP